MSLRFKMNWPAHITKQYMLCSPNVHVQRPVIFIIMFFTRRRCCLIGWVCWWSLSISGGPHALDSVAVASPSLSWLLGIPAQLWLLWLYLSLAKMSQYNFPVLLLIYFVVFCPLIIVFYLFQVRTFAACSLRSFQKSAECQQIFYGHEVSHEQSSLQPFLE